MNVEGGTLVSLEVPTVAQFKK